MGPYATFILAAYGAAILIVAALVGWIVLDYLWLRRVLADYEARGLSRGREVGAKASR
jgi:heme exporter protein D